MTLVMWALWGLSGAFVYAAPRLLVSLFDASQPGRPAKSVAEFLVAISFGPIAAAGFGPFLADEFHRTSASELRAAAVVAGMIVNSAAPSLVKLFTEGLLRWAGQPLDKRKTP